MAALGLKQVRIGEFSWALLEPWRNHFEFDWLDCVLEKLHEAGLKVTLGTPTAAPPKWLVDEMPDMLPVDVRGHVLGFGARRHYDFTHEGYLKESKRIVTHLAKHFGKHRAIVAWQIDNEYGCHGTTLSYSNAARAGFRLWLKQKYQSPEALNQAWGNVFWSAKINDFCEIELPGQAVAQSNPAQEMDFRRFTSDMVVRFNKAQADIIRAHSPGRQIVHNFMGRELAFDHFAVGADLDISSWDSYPLGFLEDRIGPHGNDYSLYARSGDPDFQAFHHDLYRAVGRGRWGVMEQQPGPVNWASHNPAPRSGMVRLWSWEAFAHGAEMVNYFRWRQVPFAQEQMHAGLLRPDSEETEGFREVYQVARELAGLKVALAHKTGRGDVGLVFDYPSAWAWSIQPQGSDFDYFGLVFEIYRGLRRLGLSIDMIPAAEPNFRGYGLIVIPALFTWTPEFIEAIRQHEGYTLIGPRSGSKTADFSIPEGLPPALPRDIINLRVSQVESLRADTPVPISGGGAYRFWREFLEVGSGTQAVLTSEDGVPALAVQGRCSYLGGWPDSLLLDNILKRLAHKGGIATQDLSEGVRLRRHGAHVFAFNYGPAPFDLTALGWTGKPILGDLMLEPSGLAVAVVSQAGAQ